MPEVLRGVRVISQGAERAKKMLDGVRMVVEESVDVPGTGKVVKEWLIARGTTYCTCYVCTVFTL